VLSTGPNPTHIYAESGTFTAKVTVTDIANATATAKVVVTVQPPPTVVSATPTITLEGQTVTFSSSGSNAGGAPVTYLWDFGDGNTSTDPNPTHAYANAGVYTATLTITDAANGSTSASVVINVFHDSDRPTARFVSSELNGFVGQPVGFDATFSTDPKNNIVSYDWDFGDGSPHGSQQIISRVYAATGTYTVTLTITDGDGLTDSTNLSITVLAADQVGLFNSNIKYSVSWNRHATNSDTLSLSATVNVGATVVNSATPLSLGIVGQTFSGSAGARSLTGTLLKIQNSTLKTAVTKWTVKPGKRGTPKGTYTLSLTIKHASLGLAFNQAGVVGTKTGASKIPVKLGIGGSNLSASINSQFRFGSGGAKASGGGSGPK
jgi:PKD repeat protein